MMTLFFNFIIIISIMKFQCESFGGECSRKENVEVGHLHLPVHPHQVDGHVGVELCQCLPAHTTRSYKLCVQVCGYGHTEEIRHPGGHGLNHCCSLCTDSKSIGCILYIAT